MAYDYEKLFQDTPDALGPPTKQFVDFFQSFSVKNARVLDIGCGQGRDSLFIARHGHQVVGVDISPSGIRDLEKAAKAEGLQIEGIVADIRTYIPQAQFDVLLIDRTLHMLEQTDRIVVLERLIQSVKPKGWLLIADEPSNIPEFERVVSKHSDQWRVAYKKRGYLFMQFEC